MNKIYKIPSFYHMSFIFLAGSARIVLIGGGGSIDKFEMNGATNRLPALASRFSLSTNEQFAGICWPVLLVERCDADIFLLRSSTPKCM